MVGKIGFAGEVLDLIEHGCRIGAARDRGHHDSYDRFGYYVIDTLIIAGCHRGHAYVGGVHGDDAVQPIVGGDDTGRID